MYLSVALWLKPFGSNLGSRLKRLQQPDRLPGRTAGRSAARPPGRPPACPSGAGGWCSRAGGRLRRPHRPWAS
eukprot:11836540-Heterocapsa_arctica.AAC.1